MAGRGKIVNPIVAGGCSVAGVGLRQGGQEQQKREQGFSHGILVLVVLIVAKIIRRKFVLSDKSH